jgi:hypothetical protein
MADTFPFPEAGVSAKLPPELPASPSERRDLLPTEAGFLAKLPAEARRILDAFPALIDKVCPQKGRFRNGLKWDVAELSRLLTSGRGDRPEGYLGRPPLLHAYLRYFLPWNLYRLARLLPALPLSLNTGDAVTDLGSGPLTLPLALWIARPEFRSLNLEFRCLDRTAPALEAGKRIFAALVGPDSKWTIRTIHASLNAQVKGPPAALLTAVNVYNEAFWDIPPTDSYALTMLAEREARRLSGLAASNGAILAVEPGVPRSGEFIACLRAALMEQGRPPLAPCPHAGPCPFPGGKAVSGRRSGENQKWCHFAFDTADAPGPLKDLSAAAGIPKERAVLSFLLAGPKGNAAAVPASKSPAILPIRILSDAFSLPGEGGKRDWFGRYGCSQRGAVLAAGKKRVIDALGAGTLVHFELSREERRDVKTGALVLEAPEPQEPSFRRGRRAL